MSSHEVSPLFPKIPKIQLLPEDDAENASESQADGIPPPIKEEMSFTELPEQTEFGLEGTFSWGTENPEYGDNAQLLFTDTDSLCYEVRTSDFCGDVAGD